LDSWQSEDTRQRLLERGIDTEIFSLDKDSRPYLIFRNAVNAGKVRWPNLTHLFDELTDLDYDAFEDKVDHPDEGSKDQADAAAGATYKCLVDRIKPTEVRRNQVESKSDKVMSQYLSQLRDISERNK
jgi:hypothetical protein